MLGYLFAGFVFAALLFFAVIMVIGPAKLWAAIYGSPDLGPFELETLARTKKPHDGLLCTPGACPSGINADGELPVYDQDKASVLKKLVERIRAKSEGAEQVGGAVDEGTVRFVTFSPTMKFPDTTQFWAVSLPDGKTGLVAYARAQVGRSDFGANLKRIENWTADLAD